jgi:hypothetical protein
MLKEVLGITGKPTYIIRWLLAVVFISWLLLFLEIAPQKPSS